MGHYVNPKDGRSKEEWLIHESTMAITPKVMKEMESFERNGDWVVVLVDNGPFTAGLICYDQNEFDYIKGTLDSDKRFKAFFMVRKEKLKQFCD